MADAILAQSGIYAITNTVSGAIYVGSAVNLVRRQADHLSALRRSSHRNIILQRAWLKYGADSFVFSVLERVERVQDLIAREQFWIDGMGAKVALYNISKTAGSSLGVKHTKETRARMAAANIGRVTPEDVRRKISQANMGRICSEETRFKIGEKNKTRSKESVEGAAAKRRGMKRDAECIEKIRLARARQVMRPCSEETKAKISAAHIGMKHSAESRAKISAVQLGRVMSAESIEKMAASRRGVPRSAETKAKLSIAHTGKKMSDEARAKMSASGKARVARERLEREERDRRECSE